MIRSKSINSLLLSSRSSCLDYGPRKVLAQLLDFKPALRPLPSGLSPVAHLVSHVASTAHGLFLNRREAVIERKGKDNDHKNKDEEQQYRHEDPLLPL